MAINKVIYGTSTLIDLTADTVAADTLGKDTTAHDKSGTGITGTLESGGSGGGGETYVLNEEISLAELDLLYEDLTIEGLVIEIWDKPFECNGKSYNKMFVEGSDYMKNYIKFDSTYIGYRNATNDTTYEDKVTFDYNDEAYRKITFSTPPTGNFLTWLEANAVKQAADTAVQESKSVSITENGTTTVSPDVPYDAIKSVEVTTNVGSSPATLTINSSDYSAIPYVYYVDQNNEIKTIGHGSGDADEYPVTINSTVNNMVCINLAGMDGIPALTSYSGCNVGAISGHSKFILLIDATASVTVYNND